MADDKQDDTASPDQRYWLAEIRRAEKFFSEKFWPRAQKILKLYARQSDEDSTEQRFAMLWSNTEVMKPAVYARAPVPQVSRRYKDKDPVGRLAAELLERCSSYQFEKMGIDDVLRSVRDDMLLIARGIAWVRYKADINGEEIGDQNVIIDWLHYKQFLHTPVRKWAEVTWVAKKTYLTKKQMKQRFPKTWKGVEFDQVAERESEDDPNLKNSQQSKATVYEIWDKTTKKVYWIAKGAQEPLGVEDPLLQFENFFPVPKPVFATLTGEKLIPTPDFIYYQDQANEIDRLTARIGSLVESLKIVGFYPLGAEGDVPDVIERALKPGTENVIIGVKSWAAFSERGGPEQIVWLPIKDIVEVVRACIELRNQLVQDVYQITGISDILRGSTDPNETLGAQQIKAQWGSVRIRDRQNEMARFARDLTHMTCEIIAENFEPEYILQMANMQPEVPAPQPLPPPPQPTGDPQQDQQAMMQFQQAQQQFQQQQQAYQAEQMKFQQALALLRDDKLRGFRIDIETDSTIQPDEDAEKQRRTEFVTAIGSVMQQGAPLLMQAPELAPLLSETLLFTARGFRAGRGLEDAIEQAMTSLQERLTQAVQQQPTDPNAGVVEAKAKQAEQDLAHKQRLDEEEFMHKQRMNQLEFESKQRNADADVEIATMKAQTGLKSEKQRLREQIIAEEQEAFMGQNPEQPNVLAEVIMQGLNGVLQVVAQSNQSVVDSNNQVLKLLSAPKTITAPDGRTYTAQTRVMN